MRRKFLLAVAVLLLSPVVAGCSNANREQDLQQQKLLLELSKANTERLAEIAKKEEELKSHENAYRAREQKLSEKDAVISERESAIDSKLKSIDAKIVQVEATFQHERAAIDADKERLNAAAIKVQKAQQELETKQSAAEEKAGIEKAVKLAAAQAAAAKVKADAIDPEYHHLRALSYFANRKYDNAIAEDNEAIRLKPNYGEAYFNRGRAYYAELELQKAEVDFIEAKRLGYSER